MNEQKHRYPIPIIMHTKYEDALEISYTHISYAEPGTMVLIIGMSGSGKGTLACEIKGRLLKSNPTVTKWNQPILEMVSKDADNSYYSSKDTASRLLNILKDPFHSVEREDVLAEVGITAGPVSHRAVPESTIRQQVHRLLTGKGVKYLFVDEADMMCVSKRSGRDEADHLESWRLLALDAGIVVVFLAGYRMLRIWDRTSQFTRKMPTVHVTRYTLGSDDDIESFIALIEQMNEIHHVAAKEAKRILGHAAAIMRATGGIFGQLKGLYERADDHAAAKGRKSIELCDIEYALPKKKQIKRLWDEIDYGDEALGTVGLAELTRLAMRAREKEKAREKAKEREEEKASTQAGSADGVSEKSASGSPADAASGSDSTSNAKAKTSDQRRRRPRPKSRRPVRTS
jgi:hypothetical protein